MIDEGGEEGEEAKPLIPLGILYCILLIAQIQGGPKKSL
jgi:hypothetical protein